MNFLYLGPLLFVLFYVFYNLQIKLGFEKPEVFVTIASFLFAIFTGFFMSRQNQRHVNIRQEIANSDGEFTNVYRTMGHISKKAQKEAGKIIKKHFSQMLKSNDWAYHVKRKTSSLTDLHQILAKHVAIKKLPSRKHIAVQYIMDSLRQLQISRKRIIAFHKERISKMQWSLIIILTVILLGSLSFLHNVSWIVPVYKAFYAVIIITVILYIYRLNNLTLFQDAFGRMSSQDVIDIIEGKK